MRPSVPILGMAAASQTPSRLREDLESGEVGGRLEEAHEPEERSRSRRVAPQHRLEALEVPLGAPLAVHEMRGAVDRGRNVRPRTARRLREETGVLPEEREPLLLGPRLE